MVDYVSTLCQASNMAAIKPHKKKANIMEIAGYKANNPKRQDFAVLWAGLAGLTIPTLFGVIVACINLYMGGF